MMNQKTMNKILFAGSGYFAALQIIGLLKKYKNLEIITQKNDNPVKGEIKNLGLTVYEVSNKKKLEETLESLKPDLLIVSDFGIILSPKSLSVPKLTINTHPSLLPKYRGPSPYISALLNGDKETGVTIIRMTEGIDEGPIYLQEKMTITNNENQISLRKKLADLTFKMLIDNLENIYKGTIKPIPQDNNKANYTKLFTKEDGKINWQENAEVIERKIRALNPWPGTFTFFKLKSGKELRVKILNAYIEKNNDLEIDRLKIENDKLKIKALDHYLVITKIQPEGKKGMNIKEFLNGYRNILSFTE